MKSLYGDDLATILGREMMGASLWGDWRFFQLYGRVELFSDFAGALDFCVHFARQ